MKRILSILLAAALLLPAGCAPAAPAEEGEVRLSVVATTYPIYLLAREVIQGVEGVEVERLNTGSVSCLHDYTLSVDDMKKLERADVVAVNGAGLEDFMSDALASSDAAVIDCSEGVELLENLSHDHAEGDEDHDHGHWDPHYWMDPRNAAEMAGNIARGLAQADPDYEGTYLSNLSRTGTFLYSWYGNLEALLNWDEGPEITGLVTFHDGFQYFARAYGLSLLAAIEEEAGSEASARELVEIIDLIEQYQLPAIFTEANGSDATANAVSRETGVKVAQLTMLMSAEAVPADSDDPYRAGLEQNVNTILEAYE